MAETERHRSMEDVFEKVGALGAQFTSLTSRLDALATERQQQHVEAIKLLTDTVAQYHEIKHRLDNNSTKFDAIDRKIERYGETLERHVAEDLVRFDKHEAAALVTAAALEKEVVANRDSVMARLDDLFAWRNLVRGAWAVISAVAAALLVVFGPDILELGKRLFHWGGK